MKKSTFEAALASDMDAIMKDSEFNSIFSKASVLSKTASDMNCAHDCAEEHKHEHKCDSECEDTAAADDGSLSIEAAVSHALNSLRKVSEVLDEVGLEKTATLSLNLANYIIVEAKKKQMSKKDEKKDAKKDKKDDKKSDKKSDKNDAKKPAVKKDDKKSDKKDEKKSDKFDKKAPPFAKKK